MASRARKAAEPRREPPVRPADDRFLDDAALDERDALVLEETGPDAQQLVAKREELRVRLDRLTDEQLAAYMPEGFEGGRVALVTHLTESATEMPNADYRVLLSALDEQHDQTEES